MYIKTQNEFLEPIHMNSQENPMTLNGHIGTLRVFGEKVFVSRPKLRPTDENFELGLKNNS